MITSNRLLRSAAYAMVLVAFLAPRPAAATCTVAASAARRPGWLDRAPMAHYLDLFVTPPGLAVPSVREGLANGTLSLLEQIAAARAIAVEAELRVFAESLRGERTTQGVTAVNADEQQRVTERIEARARQVVRGFHVVEVYWERRCEAEASAFDVWVLGGVPREFPRLDDEVDRAITRSDVVWRSAVVPGWGQFHNDRPGWGATFVTGFALTLATTATAFGMHRYELGQRDISRTQASRDELNRQVDIWNGVGWSALGATLVVYTLNLIHAGVMDLPRDYSDLRYEAPVSVAPFERGLVISLGGYF